MFAEKKHYDTADAAAKLVADANQYAKRGRDPYEQGWEHDYKLVKRIHPLTMFRTTPPTYPYQSDLHLPTAIRNIEMAMPRVVLPLLANSPMVRCKPREEGDVEAALATSALLDYQFNEPLDIWTFLPDFVRAMLIWPAAWAKVGWALDTYRCRRSKFDPKTGSYSVEKSERYVRGHPSCELCSIWDVYADPKGDEVDNCRFIQHRSITSVDKLKAKIDADPKRDWQNVEKVTGDDVKGSINADRDYQTKRREWSDKSLPAQAALHDDRRLEILDHWEDEVHIMVAMGVQKKKGRTGKGSNVCFLLEGNPYDHGRKPFILGRYIKIPHELYGQGFTEIQRDLYHEKNTRRNQRMDNVTCGINQLLFYDGTRVNERDISSRPWGRVKVAGNPRNAAHVFQAPDMTPRAYEEDRMIDGEIVATAGLLPAGPGLTHTVHETARGMAMQREPAEARFELQVRSVAQGCMRKLAKLVHEMDRQYLTSQGVVRIVGKQGYAFRGWTASQINRDFDIEFTCTPEEANRGVQRAQFIQGIAALAASPAAEGTDWDEVREEWLRLMGYKGDVARFTRKRRTRPELENETFADTGRFPPVNPDDDDNDHLAAMEVAVTNGLLAEAIRRYGESAVRAFQTHAREHARRGQARQQAVQRTARQLAQPAQPAPAPAEEGAAG